MRADRRLSGSKCDAYAPQNRPMELFCVRPQLQRFVTDHRVDVLTNAKGHGGALRSSVLPRWLRAVGQREEQPRVLCFKSLGDV